MISIFLLQDAFAFVEACDIGQVAAYMYKLFELPLGTSKRSSSFCAIQRKYRSHKILVYEKQYSKDIFFLEKHPYSF
jgi:hypothetical protein